jgi:hypothetical protein
MDFSFTLPPFTRIRQQFPATRIEDPGAHLRRELTGCGVSPKAGTRIAIAVGSRGIDHIAQLVRELVVWVKSHRAEPFIVPAMGSHGGATAEGQRAILEGYGITEEFVGAPIRSSMEVLELPRGDVPVPVYWDRQAATADGTILINRIKPHTSFHARHESGLMKMAVIGLGKDTQARAIHELGLRGLREVMPQAARQVLRHANVLLGVGLVENSRDELAAIRAIPASAIPDEEPPLLEVARGYLPHLPVADLDVLIVEEMGKNISGLGVDTNVIGRLRIPGQPEPESPRIKTIFVRDLTDQSHGNAIGMGLVDVITRRFFERIDFAATYENMLTTTFLERAKTPIIAETDRQAIGIALRAGGATPAAARILRIRNTLRLEELQASPAVVEELRGRTGIELCEEVGQILTGEDLQPFRG